MSPFTAVTTMATCHGPSRLTEPLEVDRQAHQFGTVIVSSSL